MGLPDVELSQPEHLHNSISHDIHKLTHKYKQAKTGMPDNPHVQSEVLHDDKK